MALSGAASAGPTSRSAQVVQPFNMTHSTTAHSVRREYIAPIASADRPSSTLELGSRTVTSSLRPGTAVVVPAPITAVGWSRVARLNPPDLRPDPADRSGLVGTYAMSDLS
jgi:hypothetical protein